MNHFIGCIIIIEAHEGKENAIRVVNTDLGFMKHNYNLIKYIYVILIKTVHDF